MEWTLRQLITMTLQRSDSDGDPSGFITETFIVTKLLPGTRRKDFVGMRGRRDLESINVVSDSHYLMKFRSTDATGNDDYWTLLDRQGQLLELPKKCKALLQWSTFAAGPSRMLDTGC